MTLFKNPIFLGTLGITAYLGKIYINGGQCSIKKDLTGKTILITGANSGIGKETALELAKQKATIILACRSPQKTQEVIEEIKKQTNNQNIDFQQLDLNDLNSVKNFGENFQKSHKNLDILINNAGVYNVEYLKTAQGLEQNFGVNHLGHFLLTQYLLPALKNTEKSRIINVASRAHERAPKYTQLDDKDTSYFCDNFSLYTYPKSKLANIMFTNYLSQQIEKEQKLQNGNGPEMKVCSLHPGIVRTSIARNIFAQDFYTKFGKYFEYLFYPLVLYTTKSNFQGAQTTLQCALMDYDQLENGGYYSDCRSKTPGSNSTNFEDNQKLWQLSEQLVKEYLPKKE